MQLVRIGVPSLKQDPELIRELAALMKTGSLINIKDSTVPEFTVDNFPEDIFLKLKQAHGLSEDFGDYIFCVVPSEFGERGENWNLYISGKENITIVEINLEKGLIGDNISLGDALLEAIRDKKEQIDLM